MTPLQREALQMCLEYIETDAHERRHVRWKINEALAEPQQEPVEWVDAGDLKQLKKGDVIRVIRNGEMYYSPFRYCGVLEECDYAYYRETSQFVYLEVGMATVEKIVYTKKDFATGAVYADRGYRVEAAHGIKGDA